MSHVAVEAARTNASEFESALPRATHILAQAWQASLAGGLASADLELLAQHAFCQARYASADADPRRLLQLHALLLRTHGPFVELVRLLPQVFDRIRHRYGHAPFPGLSAVPPVRRAVRGRTTSTVCNRSSGIARVRRNSRPSEIRSSRPMIW